MSLEIHEHHDHQPFIDIHLHHAMLLCFSKKLIFLFFTQIITFYYFAHCPHHFIMLTLSHSSQIKQKPWYRKYPLFLSLGQQTCLTCTYFFYLPDAVEKLPAPADIIPSLRVPFPLTFKELSFLVMTPVSCIISLSFCNELFLLACKGCPPSHVFK